MTSVVKLFQRPSAFLNTFQNREWDNEVVINFLSNKWPITLLPLHQPQRSLLTLLHIRIVTIQLNLGNNI